MWFLKLVNILFSVRTESTSHWPNLVLSGNNSTRNRFGPRTCLGLYETTMALNGSWAGVSVLLLPAYTLSTNCLLRHLGIICSIVLLKILQPKLPLDWKNYVTQYLYSWRGITSVWAGNTALCVDHIIITQCPPGWKDVPRGGVISSNALSVLPCISLCLPLSAHCNQCSSPTAHTHLSAHLYSTRQLPFGGFHLKLQTLFLCHDIKCMCHKWLYIEYVKLWTEITCTSARVEYWC